MATPVFCCGFECGVATGAGLAVGHGAITGAAAFNTNASFVRSGARSLRLNDTATSYFEKTLVSSNIWVIRYYVYFSTLTTDNIFIGYPSLSTRAGALFRGSDSKIYAATGNTTNSESLGATGVSVTTGQWYRIDIKVDSSANPWLIDVNVDGVACGQRSTALAAASTANFRMGTATSIVVSSYDYYLDDILVSQTSGDYPLGAGYVNHFVPTADGTHNVAGTNDFEIGTGGVDINNATTTAWQLIDDVPMQSGAIGTTDFINLIAPAAATNYVECIYGPASGISTPTVAPRAVEALVGYAENSAGVNNIRLALNDNGTTNDVFNGDPGGGTTIAYSRKHYATGPAGTWTVVSGAGNFNNIRIRCYSSDPAPDTYFASTMIEAEFPEGTVVTIPVGTITIEGVAPSVSVTNNINLSIPVGTIVIAGVAPAITATDHKNFNIPVGDVVIDGVAPSVTASNHQNFSTGVGEVVIEGVAPSVSVSDNQNFSIPVGEVSIEGIAPSVSVTNNINLLTDVGEIVIEGIEPTLSISDHKNLEISVGEVIIEGIEPTVTASDHKNLTIPTGEVSIEGVAPTLSISNHINLEIPAGEIIISGVAPSIGGNANLQIGVGEILIEGVAPSVSVSNNINLSIGVGEVIINGVAPSVETPVNLNIPAGSIVINGIAPTFSGGEEPIVVDSTVWIKFGKFSIMPCDPCAPKFIVSCLTDEPTDNYDFNIYGLANGVYYWRITEGSTILTKAFNHVEGTPLSIAVSDVPDGFFTTKRTFLFEILKTASSENPIPFLIGQYVEQLSIDIECNIYPSNTVGEDTTP